MRKQINGEILSSNNIGINILKIIDGINQKGLK